MSSPMSEKLSYVKDRIDNAVWMIRNGNFRLFIKSIWIEIDHRIRHIRASILNRKNADYSALPGSAYSDKRRVLPASYRPTQSRRMPAVILDIDLRALQTDIDGILESIAIEEAANK